MDPLFYLLFFTPATLIDHVSGKCLIFIITIIYLLLEIKLWNKKKLSIWFFNFLGCKVVFFVEKLGFTSVELNIINTLKLNTTFTERHRFVLSDVTTVSSNQGEMNSY